MPSNIAGATDVVCAIGNPLAEREEYGDARVKILDFGLARMEQLDEQLTGSGMIMGTPAYMSPEQADGDDVDVRTDLFSLGIVLYRMATGEQPFQGKTTSAMLKSVAMVQPAPPQQLRADIPSDLSNFILQLLEKDRTHRPFSATEVSRMLAEFEPRKMATSGDSNRVIVNQQKQKWKSVRPFARIALAFAVVMLVLGVIVKGQSPFDALDPAAIPESERFDWQPKELVAVIGTHRQQLGDAAASEKSADSEVREKNLVQPQPVVKGGPGRRIFVSNDGKHIVTHSEDGFQVWRLNGAACQQLDSSNQLHQTSGPAGFVNSTQFTTSGNETYQWRIDGDRVVLVGEVFDQIAPLASSPSGLILSNDINKPATNLSLWQADQLPGRQISSWPAVPPGRELYMLHARYGYFVSADGRRLVSVDGVPGDAINPVIRVWQRSSDTAVPTEFATISLPDDQLHQLTLSPDGQFLGVASQHALSLWKLGAGKAERLWEKIEGYAQAVTFSPDGQQIASSVNRVVGNGSGIVTIHNLQGERSHRWTLPTAPTDLAFAPDGRHLLTANTNGTVYILRLPELAKNP